MRNRSNLCKKMDFEIFDDRTLLTQGREILFYEFFNFFWNMFNSKASKVRYTITIHR